MRSTNVLTISEKPPSWSVSWVKLGSLYITLYSLLTSGDIQSAGERRWGQHHRRLTGLQTPGALDALWVPYLDSWPSIFLWSTSSFVVGVRPQWEALRTHTNTHTHVRQLKVGCGRLTQILYAPTRHAHSISDEWVLHYAHSADTV